MPIFNDYSPAGELIESRDEILSPANHKRYLTEFGIEQTKGYIEATSDLVKAIQLILYTPQEYGSVPRTTTSVRKRLLEFLESRHELLNFHILKQPDLNSNTKFEQ